MTNMIKIVDTRLEHFDNFELRSIHEVPQYKEFYKARVALGQKSKTFIHQDEVLGMIGAEEIYPHSFHLYAALSQKMLKAPKSFHESVHITLRWFIAKYKARRLQCFVRADFLAGIKWVESFGFKAEGYLREYGPTGIDYFVFGRIIPCGG